MEQKIDIAPMERMKQIAVSSLEAVRDAVVFDKLTDGDKVEFFEHFKEDIVDMLDRKIERCK